MERKSNTKKIGNILHLHYHWYRFKTATFNIQGQQQPSSINCVMLGHVKQVCNTWQNFPLLCNQKVTSHKLWICFVITWSTLLVKEDGGNFEFVKFRVLSLLKEARKENELSVNLQSLLAKAYRTLVFSGQEKIIHQKQAGLSWCYSVFFNWL